MEHTELLKYIKCPITNLIYSEPVLADDGQFYEAMSLKFYLLKNDVSPVTGEKMGKIILYAKNMKSLVADFLEKNPEYKKDQFLSKKPFYLFGKEFYESLQNKNYDDIMKYTDIILNTDIGKETLFEIICKTCPDNVIQYVIDNSIDYDTYDKRKLKPFHLVCKYASPNIIMHFMNKQINLESEDLNGETPMSYLILYRNQDIYKQLIPEFIKMKVDVNAMNHNGFTVAHYLINRGELELLKLFIENGLNLMGISKRIGNMNLIQFAFKECPSEELISYLISLNINLDIDIDPKTSCEQLIYMNRFLEKRQKQHIVLQYLTKILKKPVIVEDFINTI